MTVLGVGLAVGCGVAPRQALDAPSAEKTEENRAIAGGVAPRSVSEPAAGPEAPKVTEPGRGDARSDAGGGAVASEGTRERVGAAAEGDRSPVYGGGDLKPDAGADPVLARVAGEEVRSSDLYTALRLEWPGAVEAALRDRVREILVRREAGRIGITVAREDVAERVRNVLADQARRVAEAVSGGMTFEDFVRGQYGMEPEEFRAVVRRKVIATALLERLVRYEAMQQDCYELAVILSRSNAEAEELRAKLEEGASFAVLAREHSVHETAKQGGRLPPLPVSFRSPLSDGAVELAEGQISRVLTVDLGARRLYKIIRVIHIFPARPGSWAECSEVVLRELQERPLDGLEIPAWEQRLSQRYHVEPAGRPAGRGGS